MKTKTKKPKQISDKQAILRFKKKAPLRSVVFFVAGGTGSFTIIWADGGHLSAVVPMGVDEFGDGFVEATTAYLGSRAATKKAVAKSKPKKRPAKK